ncbi:MAG: transporter substrate-binding domain-containing protein [Desulfobacteraceae bacterium]|nr:transporter substrate-binding domain-containing protein [Desulfobacteraceae bacterium]
MSGSSKPKKAGLFLVLLLAVFAISDTIWAGGLEDARRRGKLLAGVRTESPPFGYLDSSGTPQGFDVEIAKILAKALFDDDEQRLELVPVTPGSRIPFLYSNWIDVIIATTSITDDRRKVLEFSNPYFNSGSLLLVRDDSPVKGVEDLKGKNVGVLESTIQEQDIRESAPEARVTRFAKFDEALQSLKDRKVDALCEDDLIVMRLAGQNPGLRTAGQPFRQRPYAIAVRKGDVQFVNWINAQLEKAKKDGRYEKLVRQYLGEAGEGMIKP